MSLYYTSKCTWEGRNVYIVYVYEYNILIELLAWLGKWVKYSNLSQNFNDFRKKYWLIFIHNLSLISQTFDMVIYIIHFRFI
jgi:hypothetical protein